MTWYSSGAFVFKSGIVGINESLNFYEKKAIMSLLKFKSKYTEISPNVPTKISAYWIKFLLSPTGCVEFLLKINTIGKLLDSAGN